MWRAWVRPLFLGCLGIAVTPQVQAQSGGGRGEGCIGLSMPCLYGPASDPSCAARAARPGPTPAADCRLLGIQAPGLHRDALAWLQARVRSETLPAVCIQLDLRPQPNPSPAPSAAHPTGGAGAGRP